MDHPITHKMVAISLPPELLEMILGEIKTTTDLAEASLVSSDWLRCAHPFLFRKLRTSPIRANGSKNLQSAISFLQTSPHIARYVKHITVDDHDAGIGSRPSRTYSVVVTRDALDALLSHLPNLHSMTMSGVSYGSSAAPPALHASVYTLQELLLDDIGSRHADLKDLIDCLSIFSHLGKLTVRYPYFCNLAPRSHKDPVDNLSMADMLRGLSVSTLQLNDVDLSSAEHLASIFCHTNMCRALRSFAFNPLTVRPCPESEALLGLGQLLVGAAAQLESIDIHMLRGPSALFPRYHVTANRMKQTFLQLASVRKCAIRLVFFSGKRDATYREGVWAYLAVTLTALPPNVQHIVVSLSDLESTVLFQDDVNIALWTLGGFDLRVFELSLLQFKELTSIRLLSSYGLLPNEQEEITKACPRLAEKGILHFN